MAVVVPDTAPVDGFTFSSSTFWFDVVVLTTLYNVAGEFVLRAEMQPILGDVREACRAYGYDRITWLDSRNPVD